jgi:hypothetical protein
MVVNALLGGIVGKIVQQVAHIMQQGCGHQAGSRPTLFSKPRGLECMLAL